MGGKHRAGAALLLAASLLGSLSWSLPAVAQSPEEQRVDEAAATLEVLRSQIERAAAQRDKEAVALDVADRRVREVQQAVDQAEQAVQRQQRAVVEAEERLDGLEAAERHRKKAYVGRAVERYKQPSPPLNAVLGRRSLDHVLRASAYLDAISRSERSQLEQLRAGAASVTAQRVQLASEQTTLERVVAKKQALLDDAEALRKSRALQFASAQDEVVDLKQQERIAAATSREVAAVARRAAQSSSVSRSSGAPPAAASSSGGWVWPAGGPVTSEFGPRWGRMHEGIDVGAPSGAPIYASSSGVVASAGSMGGYGQLTLVDHGNGVVTAYAHQSRIGVSVGQRVTAGQVIGAIGSTGNVTGPHLHFETRVGGYPRNPREYLP